MEALIPGGMEFFFFSLSPNLKSSRGFVPVRITYRYLSSKPCLCNMDKRLKASGVDGEIGIKGKRVIFLFLSSTNYEKCSPL